MKPYHRAPHLLIGFPTRYIDRGWSPSMQALPEPNIARARSAASPRYGTALTEGLLMASRDGVHFNAGMKHSCVLASSGRAWNYGQQYIAWHVVETKSALRRGTP